MSGKGNEAYEKFSREMGEKYGHMLQKVDPNAPVREFAPSDEFPRSPDETATRRTLDKHQPRTTPGEDMSLIFAGAFYYALAFVMAITYIFSESPNRIAFLFAAVMFMINGAAERIIANVKASAKR